MGRVCTICSHEKRAEIESAIVSGTSYRVISSQFGVGNNSVQRHASEHIAHAIKQSRAAKEEAQALNVVEQLRTINEVALAIMREARSDKKNGMALFAIDRVQKQLELQAKLLGDIDTPQVNIYLSPEWQAIRTTLVQALLPFPDARVAVASVLAGLEGQYASLN